MAAHRPLVIGTGAMASRLAQRLADGGMEVTVWNHDAERAQCLEGPRLRPVRSLADALQQPPSPSCASPMTQLCWSLGDKSESPDRGLRPGTLVIDSTSMLPATARSSQSSARASPMSGAPEAAEVGTPSLLCGGQPLDVDAASGTGSARDHRRTRATERARWRSSPTRPPLERADHAPSATSVFAAKPDQLVALGLGQTRPLAGLDLLSGKPVPQT